MAKYKYRVKNRLNILRILMKNIEFTREFLHLKCIDTIEVHVYETEKGVFPVDIISNVGGSITDAELKIPL